MKLKDSVRAEAVGWRARGWLGADHVDLGGWLGKVALCRTLGLQLTWFRGTTRSLFELDLNLNRVSEYTKLL